MTVTITKPSFNLRDALVSLKRKIGIKGAELMAAETVSDVYSVIGTNRNKIINGDMRIDQRNNGTSVSTATTNNWTAFGVDRFNLSFRPSTGVATAQRVTDVPTGQNFTYSLKATQVSTTAASSSDVYQFYHRIEGYNINDFAFGTTGASSLAISFWVKASIAGPYSLGLVSGYDGSTYRSYVTDYDVTIPNAWQKITVIIPGDAGGTSTWASASGNGIGISVYWDLGSGSLYQTSTTNTWQNGNYSSSNRRTSIMPTSGSTFQITGVQLEKGTVATPFEHRLYGTELALCQRYCYVVGGSTGGARIGPGFVFSTTGAIGTITFPTIMRSSPSFSGSTSVTVNDNIGGYTVSNITLNDSNVQFAAFNLTSTGLTAGRGMQWYFTSSGTNYLILSSEL